MNTVAARCSPIKVRQFAMSSTLPHSTRWPPSSHRSPGLLTVGPDPNSGTASAGLAARSGGASSAAIRKSISATSKPVTSRLKSSPISERSSLFSQQPVVPDGDFAQPVVGDHERPHLGPGQVVEADCRHLGPAELTHANNRPCPAMTLSSASISTGTLKPRVAMLLAICRICFLLCCRGFAGSGSDRQSDDK